MNETTKRDAVHFKCEQCGREGGRAIFTCPERPSGRCPYVEQWREKTYSSPILGLALGVSLYLVLAMFNAMLQLEASPFHLLVILLPAGLIFGGRYLVRPEKVLLYNSDSGVRLQRTTLWGIELSYNSATSGKPVPIDLALPQPLAYPPSITAFLSMKEAVAILRTTLIGLLAKGYIQVYHFQSCEFKRWSRRQSVQDVYSIVATQKFDRALFKGRLERKIMLILVNWSIREEAKEWSDGPPIYDLVRAIYESDKDAPSKWLAQLVAKDAVAQGWGQFKGFWKRFELDAAHANQIQREWEIVKALSKRLAQLHPNFSLALNVQIERGIKSRIKPTEVPDVDFD